MTIKLNKELSYETILYKSGSSHSAAVILLNEIVDNYQLQLISDPVEPSQQILYSPLESGWKTNYKYFEEKFGFKYYKTRYGFRKLEDYNLIKREMIPISPKVANSAGGSELYIFLNLKEIKKLLRL